MDDTACRRFFLEPTQLLHRRYTALHAFFIEGLTPQAIGERFGLTYHTVRSWVRDFRAQCRAGQMPPFSPSHGGGGRPPQRGASSRGRTKPRRPTAASSTWPRGGGYAPGSPGCSCSCRC